MLILLTLREQLYLGKVKLKCKISLSIPDATLKDVCENAVKNMKHI